MLQLIHMIISNIEQDKTKLSVFVEDMITSFQNRNFESLQNAMQLYEYHISSSLKKESFQIVFERIENKDYGVTNLSNRTITLNLYNINSLEALLISYFHEQGHEMEPYLLNQEILNNYFYNELKLCNEAMFDVDDLRMLGVSDFNKCYHYQPSELFADTYAYEMIKYHALKEKLNWKRTKGMIMDFKEVKNSLYHQMILYLILNDAEINDRSIYEVYQTFHLKRHKYKKHEKEFVKKFIP